MLICGCVAKAPLWSQRATWGGCRASRQGKGKRRKFMISSLEQRALRDMNTFTLGPPPEEGRRGSNSNGNGRKIIGGSRPWRANQVLGGRFEQMLPFVRERKSWWGSSDLGGRKASCWYRCCAWQWWLQAGCKRWVATSNCVVHLQKALRVSPMCVILWLEVVICMFVYFFCFFFGDQWLLRNIQLKRNCCLIDCNHFSFLTWWGLKENDLLRKCFSLPFHVFGIQWSSTQSTTCWIV